MDSMQFKVLFQMFLQFCHALISELTLNPGVCFKFQRNGTIHNSVMKCQLMDGSKNSGSMHKITRGIKLYCQRSLNSMIPIFFLLLQFLDCLFIDKVASKSLP